MMALTEQGLRRVEDARLLRVEEKIDKLGDAMLTLARNETKTNTALEEIKNIRLSVQTLESKVGDIAVTQATSGGKSSVTDRIFYVFMVAFVGFVANLVLGHL